MKPDTDKYEQMKKKGNQKKRENQRKKKEWHSNAEGDEETK
jgi:hypothetical protein